MDSFRQRLFRPRLILSIELYAIYFLLLVVIGIMIFHINETRINRQKIADFSQTMVKEQLKFMQRTVDRWEQLQNNNPQIKVPLVIEPNNKGKLEPEDMERVKTN